MGTDDESGPQPELARVLVVDDYVPNLTALQALLEPITAVTVVDSGARALEEISRRDYAVVVLDIQMPLMNGIEVARRIRSGSRNAQVPIIFVTAMDGGITPILEGYAAGAVDYIRRPIEPVILSSKVSIFVELYHSRERAKHEAVARTRLEAERLAAEKASREKDRFLAILSHELRTPLTSILLWSDMLLHKQLPPETTRRGLDTVDMCARQEAHIVDNVLETSRLVMGTLVLQSAAVDVSAVIADAIVDVSRLAAVREVELVRRPAATENHPPTRGDRHRLRQVMHNLLENAIKFTPPHGHVEVEHDEVPSGIRIRIKDTGAGFAPDMGPRLFSQLGPESARPAGAPGGLGLGLALAKAVIDLHGGTITAHSEGPGCGATFTIILPPGSSTNPELPPASDTR